MRALLAIPGALILALLAGASLANLLALPPVDRMFLGAMSVPIICVAFLYWAVTTRRPGRLALGGLIAGLALIAQLYIALAPGLSSAH